MTLSGPMQFLDPQSITDGQRTGIEVTVAGHRFDGRIVNWNMEQRVDRRHYRYRHSEVLGLSSYGCEMTAEFFLTPLSAYLSGHEPVFQAEQTAAASNQEELRAEVNRISKLLTESRAELKDLRARLKNEEQANERIKAQYEAMKSERDKLAADLAKFNLVLPTDAHRFELLETE